MDCACIPLGEVDLVVLVEFGTPVFDRPFVLPRWRLREEFGTPSGLEILLGEGGDVELGARTSKHILLFAFDQLTLNPLSLFICALHHSYCHIIYMLVLCFALIHIAYIHMLGCVCLCASLVLNHESFI